MTRCEGGNDDLSFSTSQGNLYKLGSLMYSRVAIIRNFYAVMHFSNRSLLLHRLRL